MRIGSLAPTNLHLNIHEGILEFDLYICIWSASRIDLQQPPAASSSLQLAWYYFWNENWNPDPYKPTFRHTWRHIGELPIYLYLASLQYQPPAASRWPDIIFDMRIEILALTNLHLDIHEGISEFDLYICIWSAYRISLQDQPPAASRWPKTILDMRIEILTITNLHLDIHKGILVWPLFSTWLASRISLQQPPVASRCLDFIFIFRIKYLSKNNIL